MELVKPPSEQVAELEVPVGKQRSVRYELPDATQINYHLQHK
jgi:hypothetical protein